jgi:hypothetical protein
MKEAARIVSPDMQLRILHAARRQSGCREINGCQRILDAAGEHCFPFRSAVEREGKQRIRGLAQICLQAMDQLG